MSQSSVVPADRRSVHRRRIYAILAGGLVLGVGAAVTLATWNDSEWAKSTFTAGSFVFQGSTDGTTFSDHTSEAGAAALTFSVNPTNLSPGDVVYAPYALKLTGTSDAALTESTAIASGGTLVAGDVTFDTAVTSAFGCNQAAFDGGSPLPSTITSGSTLNLCLKVTATAALGQGHTGDVSWTWDAVSQ
jgi:predicted ribosomally synthesized peptide with SipW-like signal peptide